MNGYPKWIQRSPELGPALATNEAEEKAIISHWKQVEKEAAKRQAEAEEEKKAEGDKTPSDKPAGA